MNDELSKMNISSALKEINHLRNELTRKIKIRKDNFRVIIPKSSTLEKEIENPNNHYVNFHKITEEIYNLADKINQLRERILKTNITTLVTIDDKEITLALLKLRIDKLSSELAQLNGLPERDWLERRRNIAKVEEEEKEVMQLSDLELESLIKNIETEKRKLENILDFKNANTLI